MHQVPGGPFQSERGRDAETLARLEAKYNLDAPMYEQYINYMGNVLIPKIRDEDFRNDVTEDYLVVIQIPGSDQSVRLMDFGPALKSRTRSVNDYFRDNLPVSLRLGVAAFFVACIIGIPLGTIAALRANSWMDYISMGVAILGVSIPVIVLGPILRYIFGVQLQDTIFGLPPTGWGTWQHYLMPSFALGFAYSALLARLTRASLLQVLDEDYIRTARAKGLRQSTVVIIHAMKNSMIPVVTVLGPILAALTTGSFVTEVIFGIPGVGQQFIKSVTNRDYNVIMGTILLYTSFLVFVNFAVDIVYGWLDPRIRYD
jgi:ABC-type dipeptide/oligopeptide/nickel transport system permease component